MLVKKELERLPLVKEIGKKDTIYKEIKSLIL